jgi:GTP cyclohydrolase IA
MKNIPPAKGRLVLTTIPDEQRKKIKNAFSMLLEALGADLTDGNFTDTAERCTRSWIEDFVIKPFNMTAFDDEPYDGMITLPAHEVYVRCPHHLERVKMIVGVSYVPRNNKIVGLSKLVRLCDHLAVGCILQETYTRLLADTIDRILAPEGVGVHTTAWHNCMQARGVKTKSPVMMKDLRGVYMHSPAAREEFLNDCNKHLYEV